jgi:hypothetical protein
LTNFSCQNIPSNKVQTFSYFARQFCGNFFCFGGFLFRTKPQLINNKFKIPQKQTLGVKRKVVDRDFPKNRK